MNRIAILGTMPAVTAPRPLYRAKGDSFWMIRKPTPTNERLAPYLMFNKKDKIVLGSEQEDSHRIWKIKLPSLLSFHRVFSSSSIFYSRDALVPSVICKAFFFSCISSFCFSPRFLDRHNKDLKPVCRDQYRPPEWMVPCSCP